VTPRHKTDGNPLTDVTVAHSWLMSRRVAARAAIILLVLGTVVSPRHLIERCLIAGGSLLTIGLGGLFFILLHHALGARWSAVAVRRLRYSAEFIVASLVFFAPALLRTGDTWSWFTEHRVLQTLHGSNDEYYQGRFMLARLAICYATWLGLAHAYSNPTSADAAPNREASQLRRLRFFSGPALIVFALTITSFSFDWIMRLQRGWHSAVLGIYIFSGAVAAALAFLALFTLACDHFSTKTPGIDLDGRHDIAKLLFGFVVFWAYIAFSQYLLMWYANLPVEMAFYRRRSTHDWQWLTLFLIAFQFVIPFVVLLSARTKRAMPTLALAALCVVAGHFLDWYWMVLPALYPEGTPLGIADAIMLATTTLTLVAITLGGLHRELSSVRPEVIWSTTVE
jgi:hypothetical protein